MWAFEDVHSMDLGKYAMAHIHHDSILESSLADRKSSVLQLLIPPIFPIPGNY